MKVKDLIKQLNRYNPDTPVYVIDSNWVGVVQEPKVQRARVDLNDEKLLPKGYRGGEDEDPAHVALITFEGMN